MENKIQIQILNNLLEINNDRITIYSLVKNEIIYEDLKKNLAACIKSSLLYKAQLTEEKNRIGSITNYEIIPKKYKTVPSQEFFNVWLVINECLSIQKYRRINSLFNESENIFKSSYDNALNEDNLKHLSLRHKNLILRQKELLRTG